ncbi:E3 ubiquitin-protein ligase synoviolin B isoform X1 [Neodiprion lecontei]|uniref:RING-type E3 ubiquitin transferase n=1 Tax=Neodiprion lecontei TaxID=441921 RepID=A0A6J0BBI1_NEOLC|nr:E3 ubiquitin-protein ligase synoviolin B isoform X1 [Neodiprion lecontei]
MRTAGITLISVALTCAVIGNAYYQKKQFYPSVVYITKSNPSMAVIYVQGLILVFIMNTFLRKIFFGNLRAAELEHLVERAWYAVTETCLAFTVFRDDFSPKFIALFTLLLFLKSFHWLAEDRVDFMERSPVITWLFHVRVLSLLTLLFTINGTMIEYAYMSTLTKGASVQLVFGFEYAILLTVVLNITIKYVLHTVDLQSENPWDNKAVFLLYTELIIGLLKVILYVAFVTIMVRIYTLPLFAFRPMYYTMRNFKKAFHDVVMSRRAIRNMNTLYPDATPEELAAADNVCIICREEMFTASKKLPCNHIFHTACLRSWFQRQQTCPTCRLNILRPTPANNGPRAQNQAPAPGQQAPQAAQAQGVNQQVDQPFQMPAGFWMGLQAQQGAGAQIQGQNNAPNIGLPPFQSVPPGSLPLFVPPFPPMVHLPPVPAPPPNLTTLTDEELRAMEGNMRQAVEARIQTLQRVQLLLDAANAMMSQYQTAAATANIPGPNVGSAAEAAEKEKKEEKANHSEDAGPSMSEQGKFAGEPLPGSSGVSNESIVQTDTKTMNATTSNENHATPSTSRTRTEPTDEKEMLRRRRLQKFIAQTTTTTD